MTKRIPNLQVALDHSDLQGAIKAAVSVGQEVDIIEAGTVCLLQVGSELVEVLRSLFPDKIIVTDTSHPICSTNGIIFGNCSTSIGTFCVCHNNLIWEKAT